MAHAYGTAAASSSTWRKGRREVCWQPPRLINQAIERTAASSRLPLETALPRLRPFPCLENNHWRHQDQLDTFVEGYWVLQIDECRARDRLGRQL